ncbi:MAG: prolyl oligopeptidase family serine peptidase, partial [Pseudomonadota bacterium]
GWRLGSFTYGLSGLLWCRSSMAEPGQAQVHHIVLEPDATPHQLLASKAGSSVAVMRAAAYPHDDHAVDIWTEGFLHAPKRLTYTGAAEPSRSTSLPATFDTTEFDYALRSVTAPDGQTVPYHLIRRRDAAGPVPTLIYAYGGFNIALDPFYLDEIGPLWLAKGRALAIPLVRGGGECGAAWQIAGREHGKLDAAQDLVTVAEDLAVSGVTTPEACVACGESNGGLLVANAARFAPKHFAGLWIASAPLDLVDYDKRGQGAIWIDEFGDPRDATLMRALSPLYHVPAPGDPYPAAIFTVSQNDDRVCAEDSARMVDALRAAGHDAWLRQGSAGGHGHGPDSLALRAVGFAFLDALARNAGRG